MTKKQTYLPLSENNLTRTNMLYKFVKLTFIKYLFEQTIYLHLL